jgi:hypothetical protein
MSPAEFLLSKSHSHTVTPIEPDLEVHWKQGSLKFTPFSVNQLVRKLVVVKDHNVTNKFKPKFEGPFVVESVNDNGLTYLIRRVGEYDCVPAHHTQLVKWKDPPDYLQNYAAECLHSLDGHEGESNIGNDKDSSVSGVSWLNLDSSSSNTNSDFSGFSDSDKSLDEPRDVSRERLAVPRSVERIRLPQDRSSLMQPIMPDEFNGDEALPSPVAASGQSCLTGVSRGLNNTGTCNENSALTLPRLDETWDWSSIQESVPSSTKSSR